MKERAKAREVTRTGLIERWTRLLESEREGIDSGQASKQKSLRKKNVRGRGLEGEHGSQNGSEQCAGDVRVEREGYTQYFANR